nr:peptidylprolyl isomerase [Nitrosomonas oligotropha]
MVLTLDAVAKNETVSDEAISTYFSEHQNEFGKAEERKASHVLITIAADATDDEKRAAKEKAESILEKIKQNPDQFAEIAKQDSDDPGSAMRGGDLGFFGRGVMVKAFEDKIFSMQLDEVSDIVETNFGFHVIKLTAIKEEKRPDLEEVREQIANKLKLEMVSSIFGEIAEDFSNIVYEQGDNLQAAAEKFELSTQESDWITRDKAEPSILANEKLLSAIFSADVISNHRNTEAIEVQPDTFVSARILEHKPATTQSLEVVREQIVEKLRKQVAEAKAVEEGQAKLVRLQAGEAVNDVTWDEVKQISYMQPQGLDHETLRAVFRAKTNALPVYTGAINPKGGFNLIRINKVVESESADKNKLDVFTKQLQQMITQEEVSSYLAALRQRYDVKVKQDGF